MKKISLLSPVLLTLSGILYLYASSSFVVSPDQLLFPVLFLWLLVILLVFPSFLLTHDWDLTGILLSTFVVTLFFPYWSFIPVAVILLVVFLLWYSLSFFIKWLRRKRVLAIIFVFTSSTLIISQVFLMGRGFLSTPMTAQKVSATGEQKTGMSASQKPDVYYIVLDGYARADILQDYYFFNNSKFISYLKSKGFIIPENAHSNYPKTVLSIASTLNMDYVQNFAPGLTDSYFWWQMTPYIDHSQLRTALEQEGYDSYAIATDWGISNNQTVDHYFKLYPLVLSDFEGFFMLSTPLGALGKVVLSPFTSAPSYQAHRAFIKNNFKALSEISKISGPKFVFAHIISPHPPFVFDAEGNPLNPNYPFSLIDASDFPGTSDQYRSLYVGQVNFVNKQIETVIDQILSNSKIPPIIVLQADHGPGMFTDFTSAAKSCIRERFSILGAYYLPGLDANAVPSDVSPVNIFRIILDHFFHSDMPMLKNAQYFPDDKYIYKFQDVSSRINETCIP